MNRRRFLFPAVLLATVLLSGFCSISSADDLLFDNGNHVESAVVASTKTFPDPDVHVADDFVLPSGSVITGIQWKGLYGSTSPVDDDFKVMIYADDGNGKPTSPATDSAIYSASVTASKRQLTGDLTFADAVYQYSAAIPPFKANGKTTYWLEIFNNLVEHNNYWAWSGSFIYGNGVYAEGDTTWIRNSEQGEQTFQLFGAVPEPITVILAIIGVGLLLVSKRQRLVL